MDLMRYQETCIFGTKKEHIIFEISEIKNSKSFLVRCWYWNV